MATVGNSISNVRPRAFTQQARVGGYLPEGMSVGAMPPTAPFDTRHFGRTLVVSGMQRSDPFAPIVPFPPQLVRWYRNVWLDVDCGSPTVRAWNSPNDPDPTGLWYTGLKCGATPIAGAQWVQTWLA